MTQTVNPFYAARGQSPKAWPPASPRVVPPTYAKLPTAPRTASPTPRLTSLYHHEEPGPYGDRRYPGNCGRALIKDLLLYFRPSSVLDP